MQRSTMSRRGAVAVMAAAIVGPRASAAEPIRVGTLHFGSLSWELDVMRRHGLVEGFDLVASEFATGPASQTALQAGSVDVVLQDWIWTSRLRAAGAPWSFTPVSAGLGAVVAPQGSPIRDLADLAGRRLGIAGGPLDKSWLLLRLLARQKSRIELDTAVEKVFGPPPLLAAQMELGRLDAALTYWPFAARAEATGARTVLDMADVLAQLGAPHGLPMLGFVFSDAWADRNRAALTAFLIAAARAREILDTSDTEWDRIAPLTGATGPAELARLRDWYRRGATMPWDDAARDAAGRLFELFASIGGPALVGNTQSLAPGTFWRAG